MRREAGKRIPINRASGRQTPFMGIHPVQLLPFSVFGVFILMLYTIGVLPPIEAALLAFVVAIAWTVLTRNKITEYSEGFDKPPKLLVRARLLYRGLAGQNIKTRYTRRQRRR